MGRKTTKKEKQEEKQEPQADLIGRQEFIDKIKKLISIAPSNRGFCVGLDGAWGSGKTFVLNMLQQQLQQDEKCVVVYYNAWENDFYEDPLLAILYTILDAFEHKGNIKREVIQGIKNGIAGFVELSKLVPGLNVVVEAGTKVWKTGKKVAKKITTSAPKQTDHAQLGNYKSYLKFLEETQTSIKQLTTNTKLIVLVDELDRCEIEYAMKVLNRLHHLLSITNVFTLVAFNKNNISAVKLTQLDKREQLVFYNKFFDKIYKLPNGILQFLQNKSEEFFNRYKFPKEYLNTYTKFCAIYLNKEEPREIESVFENLEFLFKTFEDQDITFPLFTIYSLTAILMLKQKTLFGQFQTKNIRDSFSITNIHREWQLISPEISNIFCEGVSYFTSALIGRNEISRIPHVDNLQLAYILIGLTFIYLQNNSYIYEDIVKLYAGTKVNINELNTLLQAIEKYWKHLDFIKE